MKHSIGRSLKLSACSREGQSLLIFAAALGVAALAGLTAELAGNLLALAVPFLLVLLVLAVRDYRLAVWVMLFVLPLASSYLVPSKMLGLPGAHPVNLVMLLTISAMFLTQVLRPGRLAVPAWRVEFLMYLGVFAAGAVHGAFHAASIPEYFRELKIITASSPGSYLVDAFLKPSLTLATAFILSVAIRNARRPGLYLIPLFASATVFAGAVFYYAITSGSSLNELASQESRAYLSAIGMHANELGLLLNMACALALFSFFRVRRLQLKVVLGTVTFLLAAAILLTFSRGAYLGSLAVIAYLLYVQRKFAIVLLAVLVLPVAALLMPQAVTERATHGMQGNDVDAISSGRIDEIWLPLLPEIMKSPLTGSGLSSILWSDAAKQRAILPVSHPHSAYLGSLLDFGVLGSVLILLFFRHMWRLFSELGRSAQDPLWQGFFSGAAACILLLLVQGLTDDSFMPSRTQPFLWMAYGMAIGLVSRQKAMADRADPGSAGIPEPVLGKA